MSLSELWRENKSRDPGIDLASILGAARIMASSLAPNIDVKFSGVKAADTDRKTINLSARLVGDSYPVDGDRVDLLMGLTVHEMGHVLFSEDKVTVLRTIRKRLAKNKGYYHSSIEKEMHDLINILEDVYVDHLMSAFPGYRDYLRIAILSTVRDINPDKILGIMSRNVTQQEMLNAFAAIAIVGYPVPLTMLPENVGILAELGGIAQKLCSKKLSREKAIMDAWKIVSKLPKALTPEQKTDSQMQDEKPEQIQDDSEQDGSGAEIEDGDEPEPEPADAKNADGDGTESEPEPEDAEDEDDGAPSPIHDGDVTEQVDDSPDSDDISIADMLNQDIVYKVDLDKGIAEDVSQALINNREDLTQMLSLLAKDANTVIAYTPDECAEATRDARVETQQVEDTLRRILQDLRLRHTEDCRGLYSGKISSRRLHRAGYGDKRVFQRRDRLGEIDLAVCLLMDMSGSMVPFRSLVEQVTVAMCDAFKKEKLEFIALGYSADNSRVAYISRLHDRESDKIYLKLDRPKMWNSTPSYEGLAAGIAQLLRFGGDKPKILFHCTDGVPDKSVAIPELLEKARLKGIMDIHIALGSQSAVFEKIYGKSMRVKDISGLPAVIEKQLRASLGII